MKPSLDMVHLKSTQESRVPPKDLMSHGCLTGLDTRTSHLNDQIVNLTPEVYLIEKCKTLGLFMDDILGVLVIEDILMLDLSVKECNYWDHEYTHASKHKDDII